MPSEVLQITQDFRASTVFSYGAMRKYACKVININGTVIEQYCWMRGMGCL